MKGTFIVTKENLTKEERLIYTLISMNSDSKDKSNISREKLSKLSGIKTLDYISKWSGSLEKKGLIKKTYTYMEDGSKIVHYQIMKGEKWTIVNQSIREYKISPKALSLFIGLVGLRRPGSNKIKMEMEDVYAYVDFSRPSYKKYIGELVESGLVVIGDDIEINETVCPVEKVQVSKEIKDYAEKIVDCKAKRMIVWTIQNPEKINNWNGYFRYIQSGCKREGYCTSPSLNATYRF